MFFSFLIQGRRATQWLRKINSDKILHNLNLRHM
ncbi:hypothetical protein EYZ11_005429 [Aspergillus tanneri]|uniref:Uncharacterized protein n=1 Tax=Aspergillus tanneri TaxID=1220188 RepID=A0A4S3JIL8_9EURO|nr:hypothetical protein EYZ11_005429 [Aspergillus tanneri]